MVPVRYWSLAYLATGVLVSVLAQKVASSPDVDPALHVIPAAKWTSTAIVSLLAHTGMAGGQRAGSHIEKQAGAKIKVKMLTGVLGALDCAAYSLFCLGLGSCGAATAGVVLPAMGHILTALFSVTFLRNSISRRRALAVVMVFLGVLVKGWEVHTWASMDMGAWVGFGYLALASLCYSSMGILYESLVRFGSAPRHVTITLYSSIIGTLSYFVYLFAYSSNCSADGECLTRGWVQVLRGLEWRSVRALSTLSNQSILSAISAIPTWVQWLGAFAVLYNVHVYVQGMTFRSDGALGVQLVNSVRGCTAYMVFCILSGPPGTWGKGEMTGLASGLLAAAGGLLWIDAKSRTEDSVSPNAARKERAA
jgi:drug/metabolite transporter (DMT)-like permease